MLHGLPLSNEQVCKIAADYLELEKNITQQRVGHNVVRDYIVGECDFLMEMQLYPMRQHATEEAKLRQGTSVPRAQPYEVPLGEGVTPGFPKK